MQPDLNELERLLAALLSSSANPYEDEQRLLRWLVCFGPNVIAHVRALEAALQPFADLLPGSLENVGGGTLVSPTIKVQLIKDARAALDPNRSE
jgi:hypothetical protein